MGRSKNLSIAGCANHGCGDLLSRGSTVLVMASFDRFTYKHRCPNAASLPIAVADWGACVVL